MNLGILANLKGPLAHCSPSAEAGASLTITSARALTNTEMNTATPCLRKLPVERAHGMTPEIFHHRYLSGAGKPVVLTDAMNSWPALTRWNFEFFKTRYGSEKVLPGIWLGAKHLKYMTLNDYFDYLDAPEAPAKGFWLDPDTKYPCAPPAEPWSSPLYLSWNVFGKHPELLEDIQLSPTFVEDWLPLLPEALRKTLDEATRYFAGGIMMGPRNARVGLHRDFLDTHGCLAQILGNKRCVLFSPEDSAAVYEGRVDVDDPDFEKFPLFRDATAYECILAPGELLFMPHHWWHHVVSLEKTITINYNFFNRFNFSGYMTHLLRELPALVNGLESLPDARSALGLRWISRGFDFPETGQS